MDGDGDNGDGEGDKARILNDFGFWILDFRFWICDFGLLGFLILVLGLLRQDYGDRRILD